MPATSLILFTSFSETIHLEAFALGCVLLVAITLIHITGLDRIVSRYRRNSQKLKESSRSPLLASFYFSVTILLMLLLHVGDICIWGTVVNRMGLIPGIHNALYFTANTYTSLGYGDVPLPYNWRELSPIMAICGLFTFACTTSQLFNVMSSHHDVVHELSLKHQKHTG